MSATSDTQLGNSQAGVTDSTSPSDALSSAIMPLRRVRGGRSIACILREYATLIVVLAVTILICQSAVAGTVPWVAAVAAVVTAWFLVAAIQHRLMGLGHEAVHYILFRNRVINELVSDVFCMFPIFATTEHYRQIHFGHHEYSNDWERDPELINLGETRRMGDFPMPESEFVRSFALRILWPPAFVRYLVENMLTTGLAMGRHPYMLPEDAETPGRFAPLRKATVLGAVYLAAMAGITSYLSLFGTPTQVVISALGCCAIAAVGIVAMPRNWFFRSRINPIYSIKTSSFLRLAYFTALASGLAYVEAVTGYRWGTYFWLLWIVPMLTVLPYYMILRDLFQHANCDDGRLTNSRNMFVNPFVRWAVFIYGQDMHLTHHVHPSVPYFNLHQLDRALKEHDADYAAKVEETHGVFHRTTSDHTSLIEALSNGA